MAVKQIPNLPPVVTISPEAEIEVVQAGTSYRASAQQLAGLGPTGPTGSVGPSSKFTESPTPPTPESENNDGDRWFKIGRAHV